MVTIKKRFVISSRLSILLSVHRKDKRIRRSRVLEYLLGYDEFVKVIKKRSYPTTNIPAGLKCTRQNLKWHHTQENNIEKAG